MERSAEWRSSAIAGGAMRVADEAAATSVMEVATAWDAMGAGRIGMSSGRSAVARLRATWAL